MIAATPSKCTLRTAQLEDEPFFFRLFTESQEQLDLLRPNAVLSGMPGSPALALLLVPLAFTRRFRRNAARLSRGTRWLALLVLLAVLGGLSACGGHASGTKTALVTVTAVSGSVTHMTVVALSVQ